MHVPGYCPGGKESLLALEIGSGDLCSGSGESVSLFCGSRAGHSSCLLTVLAFVGSRKPWYFLSFDSSSSLFGSDWTRLIYAHKSPKETVEIHFKKKASFSLVVLSLFLIRSKELLDPMNWYVPCRWLHGMSSSGNIVLSDCVTLLSAMMMPMVSCVVMVTCLLGFGVAFRLSLLNSTAGFVTMPYCDHHIFLDLLECWALVTEVVDDCMMENDVHFIKKHWCTMINS